MWRQGAQVASCSQDSEKLFLFTTTGKRLGFLQMICSYMRPDFQDLLSFIYSFTGQLDNVSLRTRSSCVDLLNGIERQ